MVQGSLNQIFRGKGSKYGSVPIQWFQRFVSLLERRSESEALTFILPRLHGMMLRHREAYAQNYDFTGVYMIETHFIHSV
jgi:hypothetical protein